MDLLTLGVCLGGKCQKLDFRSLLIAIVVNLVAWVKAMGIGSLPSYVLSLVLSISLIACRFACTRRSLKTGQWENGHLAALEGQSPIRLNVQVLMIDVVSANTHTRSTTLSTLSPTKASISSGKFTRRLSHCSRSKYWLTSL